MVELKLGMKVKDNVTDAVGTITADVGCRIRDE